MLPRKRPITYNRRIDTYQRKLKQSSRSIEKLIWQSAIIISAHMNELLKSKKITSDKDLTGLRNFFDNIESHVRSLQGLGIESKSYGSLLAPIILDRLPQELKLIIRRNLKSEIWDLDKILLLINKELRARESCTIPSNSFNSISNDEKHG